MICDPCKNQEHDKCPAKTAEDDTKPPMGLSPEGMRVQVTGMCPCQHRDTKVVSA